MTASFDRPVLITGAAGFIGSHVAEALLAQGRRVVGLDNFDPFYDPALKRQNLGEIETSRDARSRWTFVESDLTNPAALRRVFVQHKPSGVIHLAAKAGVRPSIADPAGYSHANVTGTVVVLDEAARAGCDRVLVASSSSVYGNNTKVPFAEADDVSAPISPYAATKRACELIGHAHWHLTAMPTGMLRFFTVFGPRQRPDLAIRSFIAKIARRQTLEVFGDGSTSRDYTYIADIVAGVLSAYDRIDRHGFRVWNLGGTSAVTLRDMVATIGRVIGVEPTLVHKPMQPGDVERTWADLTRARAELGYSPSTPFEEGVRRQWEWQKTRLDD